MTTYSRGTILKHRTHNRYLRVLAPSSPIPGSVYVRNTDGAGFELDNNARWLTERHLNQTYQIHWHSDSDSQ